MWPCRAQEYKPHTPGPQHRFGNHTKHLLIPSTLPECLNTSADTKARAQVKVYVCQSTFTSDGSRISPRGGREPSKGGAWTRNFAKFSQKLHEIERIWTQRGGRASLTPPLRSATVHDHAGYEARGNETWGLEKVVNQAENHILTQY